jgi:hypothetical protein
MSLSELVASGMRAHCPDFFARALARRAALRFLAAASDAFFARARRSAAVMFFAAVLPPREPNFLARGRKTSRYAAWCVSSYWRNVQIFN